MIENVVLLIVNCLRYDRCGFNGHYANTTPNLDRLATDAHIFDRAYAPGTWTSESVPGIVAGRHAPDLAFWDKVKFKAIPRDSPTIATELGDHGYHTFATLTNPQLSRERNFHRGFDRFSNLRLERRNDSADSGVDAEGHNPFDALRRAIGERYSHNRLLARLQARTNPLNPYAALFALHSFSRCFDSEWPTVRAESVMD